MSLFIRLFLTVAAVFLLASCGGGSSGAPPLPTSGRVVEGYLEGATVVCDTNGNGVFDEGELQADRPTDAGGNFTFTAPGCAAGMLAYGGTDVDTRIDFKGVMKAPAGSTVITPLTTLLVGGMSQERLIATLGLPADTDVPNANPVFDPELMKKSLAVAQLLIKTTEMFAGLGGDSSDAALQVIYGEVATSFAILLQGGGTLIVGTEMDSLLVAQLVKAAGQRVAQLLALNTKINAESLGIVTSGGLTVQAENILKAANDAVIAAATASQNDATITEFVTRPDVAAELEKAPNSATYALGAALTELVEDALAGTLPEAPAALPITFDGATSVPFVGFNGAEGSTVEAGPAGGTGKSLRILRSGGETFAGAFITTVPIPFAADKKTFTARVHSPKAGIRMVLKVEGANGVTSADFEATPAVVAGWQTLTWVATGLDLSKSYNRIVLLPNLGTVDATPGQSYYFDDITLVTDGGTPPPSSGTALPINFDDALPATIGQFGNGAAIAVAAGPTGGSGNAAQFTKSAGDVWAGFYFPTATIPFTATSRTITARVYSPKAGAVMVMKAENGDVTAGISSGDVAATSTSVVGWQTMTWVFTNTVDLNKTYNSIAIIPDSGVVGSGQVYYFDDITLVADSGTPPPSSGTPLPINFDDAVPTLMGQFGSGAAIAVAAGPTGGSGNAAQFTKSAGDVWAGFYFPTATIPFTATSKTITAKVYSPKAGAVMVMKAENGDVSAGISSGDVAATSTSVVGWQTMTWVFTGTVDLNKTYNSIAIIPDSGVVGSGQVYYFDDITLVSDGAPPTGLVLPVTFEEVPPPTLTGFGGAEDATVVTDPVAGSGHVARVVKASGSEVWAGTTVSTGPNQSIATVPFTATAMTMSLRVWSPDAGIPVRLKLESAADGNKTVETEASTTTAGAWQTLTFDFANPVSGTPALNLATTYNKASVFFDFGRAGTGKTFYFDDLAFGTGVVIPPSSGYVALVADSISLVNGGSSKVYTMAEFESDAGISVGWPIPSPMLMKVALKEVGNLSLPAGLTVQAAVSITETVAGGKGEIQAYVANVAVRKTAGGLEIEVPTTSPDSRAYTVSTDAKKTLVIDFGSGVKGLKHTLTTAANMINSLVFGEVVQYAVNNISLQGFTGIDKLRGKYRVTVVLEDLPLRRADGTELPNQVVVVPTVLGAGGVVTSSKTVAGPGLVGYVTLTD